MAALLLTATLATPVTWAAQARTRLYCYGRSAWKITTPSGGVILIDPRLTVPTNPDRHSIAELSRVDYILITHGHGDHVGNAVEIAKKTGATLIISIEGGPTIYDTGDTDLFEDMKVIPTFHHVDVMLGCIGDHFTMGPERASVAVQWINPTHVIPMHYGTFPLLTGTPDEFHAALAKQGLAD